MIAVSGATCGWGMPNDRQLQLRAKLGVGWSTHHKDPGLSEEEQNKIKIVVQKAELLEQVEQERIGALVEKYEHIKRQARGNGTRQCILCSDEIRNVVAGTRICSDCKMAVCSKCSVDIAAKKQSHSYLCKMCSEHRELWKKSGAWFFKSMPPYKIPERSMSLLSIHLLGASRDTLARYGTAAAPLVSFASPHMPRKSSRSARHAERALSEKSADGDAKGRCCSPDKQYQPWSRIRADYSDESMDSSESEEESSSHVKYRTYCLGERIDATHSVSPPSVKNLPASHIMMSCPNDGIPDDGNPDFAAEEANAQPGEPTGSSYSSWRRRCGSASSGGSTATTAAGSAQLSATESCRDELLSRADDGEDCDTGAGTTPRQVRSQRIVFGSSWSLQSSQESFSVHFAGLPREAKKPAQRALPFPGSPAAVVTAPLGTVTFTVLYDFPRSKLEIHIFEGKHLPAVGAYVQLNLVPGRGKSRKMKTRTKHKTVDPRWNELLVYHGVSTDELHSKTLRILVKDEENASAASHYHRVIGEYRLPLSELPASQLQRFCVQLTSPIHLIEDVRSDDGLGKILLSLLYNPSRETVHITVIRCAGLIAMDQNGYSDPYVKLYLKPDKGKKSKHKTVIKKKTLNPEFNEEFIYHVGKDELSTKNLHVTVWDYDKVGKNDFIGAIVLGSSASQASSSEAEVKHWQAMLDAPNQKHEAWHRLLGISKGVSDDD